MQLQFNCLVILSFTLVSACHNGYSVNGDNNEAVQTSPPEMQIANLSDGIQAISSIREAFVNNNPGYDLAYFKAVNQVPEAEENRVVFIQEGGGTVQINEESSKFSIGDIILLKEGFSLRTDSVFSSLVFTTPEVFPAEVPNFYSTRLGSKYNRYSWGLRY